MSDFIFDVEGVLLIVFIIFEIGLFLKTGFELFLNTWWDDDTRDMDGF